VRSLALLGLVVALAACVSEEDLLEDAPRNRPTKVVVLEVEADRARLVAGEDALADLDRIPGVLKVVRGSGRNEVMCLVEDRVDPYALAAHLRPHFQVTVLRTVKKSELERE
jgi:hypothetical protein